MFERLKELICDMAKFLTRLGAGYLAGFHGSGGWRDCAGHPDAGAAQTPQSPAGAAEGPPQ